VLKACFPLELLDPGFVEAAEQAAEEMRGVRVAPFPHAVREEIYRHHLRAIRQRHANVPVTICTESLEMWRAMRVDLGITHTSYVCGCGAGATPNLESLATSPWQDARAAETWDGRRVFAEGEGVLRMVG